jgi:putative monooxygenase
MQRGNPFNGSCRSTVNALNPGFPPVILRPDALPANDRGGGNRTIPLVNDSVGSRQILNGITIIAPGSAIDRHTHNCEESVIVIGGSGVVEIDGAEHEVAMFDTTWLPPHVPHRFRNTSREAPLRIFWTYTSLDATRTMTATGETHRIAGEHEKRG